MIEQSYYPCNGVLVQTVLGSLTTHCTIILCLCERSTLYAKIFWSDRRSYAFAFCEHLQARDEPLGVRSVRIFMRDRKGLAGRDVTVPFSD